MSDERPPQDQPAAAPVLFTYRIFMVNGFTQDVQSPNDFEKFCRFAKGDGQIYTPGVWLNFNHISAIVPVVGGMALAGGTVVPFEPRPVA